MKASIREQVRQKCNGKCGYCGNDLDSKWQVDHMDSQYYHTWAWPDKDPNRYENLMPACIVCNHYKRSFPITKVSSFTITWKEYMVSFHTRYAKLPRNPVAPASIKRKAYMQRIADAYGITADKPFNGIFYYETIQSNNEKSN